MKVGESWLGSLTNPQKHFSSSHGGLQFMVGKGQRIRPKLGLKLAWHLASRRSQHTQQVPESLEAQQPAWLCPTTCIHGAH